MHTAGGTCKINYRNPRAAISVRVTFQHGALSVAYDVRNKQVPPLSRRET